MPTFLTGTSTRFPFKVYGMSWTCTIYISSVLANAMHRVLIFAARTFDGTCLGLLLALISVLIDLSRSADRTSPSTSCTKRTTRSSVPSSIDWPTAKQSTIVCAFDVAVDGEKHISTTS